MFMCGLCNWPTDCSVSTLMKWQWTAMNRKQDISLLVYQDIIQHVQSLVVACYELLNNITPNDL
jgi:hypothetical protein